MSELALGLDAFILDDLWCLQYEEWHALRDPVPSKLTIATNLVHTHNRWCPAFLWLCVFTAPSLALRQVWSHTNFEKQRL